MNKRKLNPLLAITGLLLLAGGGARAADPVITDPLSTTIGIVTGGDVGEGLDLDGTFLYALAIGAEPDFTATVRDADFLGLIDAEVPGATLIAGNRILNWYVVNYGDSADDDALEGATSSIRWSDAASGTPEVVLTLENLEVGVEYKVQMMFGEQCCNRGYDILFNDQLVVKDLNPGVVQEGINMGSQEAVVTHTFTPLSPTLVIRFDGRESSTDYSDHNAILNAVTVERVGIPPDADSDGMPDAWETLYGFNPANASDAALDFDGDGATNLQEYQAGTNPTDTTKPTLVSVKSTDSFNTVILTFSEELDTATATAVANYSISPALAVTAATYSKKVVTLTTAAQTPDATAYTVTVTGVRDTSKNEVPPDTKGVFYSFLRGKEGVLKISIWRDITGTAVQALYDDPRYPATPDAVGTLFSFNTRDFLPSDSLENYGATVEGYLTPTESGDYDFFLKSDDASELYLSTDATAANLTLIAYEEGCCRAFLEPGETPTTGTPISLIAGQKYFIRVVYKEGGGGDFAQVAWRKTTDTRPAASLLPIPGEFLSSEIDLASAAEGAFTQQVPGPNAKNVTPTPQVTITHRDGKTAWTESNVSLKFDGVAVTPTYTKNGKVLTINYGPPGLLASESVHTVTLTYPDPASNPTTLESTFTVQKWTGPTRDKVGSYPALLIGDAVFTGDKGGSTGAAGDYGMDLTIKGGPVVSTDATFLTAANAAAANDEMSVSFWVRKHDIANSSAFTVNSPGSPNQRAFHAHVPWSDGHVYFDTVGCCDGTTQRIESDIANLPTYTGDVSWWTNEWHFFTFTKKASTKRIWIDGTLFLEGDNTAVLPTDINALYIGADGGGSGLYHGVVDDFAIYSKELVEADVMALFQGTLPSALPAAKGLIGYWDFNDAAQPGNLSLTAASVVGGKIKLTLDGTGVIQSADTVNGPYTDTTIASGDEVSATGAAKFYRARK